MEPGGEILPQSRVHPRPAFNDRTPGAGVFLVGGSYPQAEPPGLDGPELQEPIIPEPPPEPDLEKSQENRLVPVLWLCFLPVMMLVLASLQLDLLFLWTRPSKASKLAKGLFQCLCISGLALVILGQHHSLNELSWRAGYLTTKVETVNQDSFLPTDRQFFESFNHLSKDAVKHLIQEYSGNKDKNKQNLLNTWIHDAIPAYAKTDQALIKFLQDHDRPLTKEEANTVALSAFQKIQLNESELNSLIEEARKTGKFDSQVSSPEVVKLLAENQRIQNLLSSEAINQILGNELKQSYTEEAIKTIGEQLLAKNTKMITEKLNLSDANIAKIMQNQISEWISTSQDPYIIKSTFQQFVDEAKTKLQTQQQQRDTTIQQINQRLADQIQNMTELGVRFEDVFTNSEQVANKIETSKIVLEQIQQQITQKDLVLTQEQVQQMIKEITQKSIKAHGFQPAVDMKQVATQIASLMDTYSADKIGLPDFALASAGGSLVFATSKIPLNGDTTFFFTNDPTVYETKVSQSLLDELSKQLQSPDLQSELPPQIAIPEAVSGVSSSFWKWFSRTNPQASTSLNILSPSLTPGDCWAFPGARGQVMVRLSCPIQVTHVSIDHAHIKTLMSSRQGAMPNQFEVKGWEQGSNGQFINPQSLLTAAYVKGNQQIQTFEVKNPSGKIFRYISLELYSNYGASFTCLYRFRVHSSKGSCHQ